MSFVAQESAKGHLIAYYPRLSSALGGDPAAAVVLQQMIYWTHVADRADSEGWVGVAGVTAMSELGMSAKTLSRVRQHLESLGLVETRRAGMPARCQIKLKTEAVDSWWDSLSLDQRAKLVSTKGPTAVSPKGKTAPILEKNKEDTQKRAGQLFEENLTFEAILGGAIDGSPKSALLRCPKHVLEPLLTRWAEVWGKEPERVRLTEKRCAAFRRAVNDGTPAKPFAPSEWAQAIIGMRFDDWPDRKNYCDWQYIAGDLLKWCELYEANTGRNIPKANAPGTKLIKGVRVPDDYVWDHHDDHNMNRGFKFDLESAKWL